MSNIGTSGMTSSGSITITGVETVSTGPASHAIGTVTIIGSEGTHQFCTMRGGRPPTICCITVSDTGQREPHRRRFLAMAPSAGRDTDPTIAQKLAIALNVLGSPVIAPSRIGSNVVTLTSIATGPTANCAGSVTGGDFTGVDSGTTLTGGAAGVPTADAGVISGSVDGQSYAVPWSSSSNPQILASLVARKLTTGTMTAFVTNVTATSATITVVSNQPETAGNGATTCSVIDIANLSPSFGTSCSNMAGGSNLVYPQSVAYSYSIPSSGGYLANGNLQTVTDSVTGSWTYKYDNLNRLTKATGNSGAYNGVGVASAVLGWTYDAFGNRTSQRSTSPNFPSSWSRLSGSNDCNTAQLPCSNPVSNQMTSSSQSIAPCSMRYDIIALRLHRGLNVSSIIRDKLLTAHDLQLESTIEQWQSKVTRVVQGLELFEL